MHTGKNYIVLLFALIAFSAFGAPSIVKNGESIIASDASTFWDDRYGDAYLNACSFIEDALVTFNGWQYAAYYNASRYVTLARRRLPDGAWERFAFTDYRQTTNDNHNTISIGISPADGRIHCSFDHHNGTLHYRKSVAGLATTPQSTAWNASQFGGVENNLGSGTVTGFTYPCFATAPNNAFILYARIGESGDGDNWIWQYNNNGTWTTRGKFVEGAGENAYHHGMVYDTNNRLHTTWCWRATSDGTTNHDLCYAFSDDNGTTWRNSSGSVVGTTPSDPITPTKNCTVWTIAQKTGLINQEAMTVDRQGRVHVFSREDVSGTNYQMHYWRDTSGSWHRVNTNIRTKTWDNRSKIVFDADGNVYGILPNVQIAYASVSSSYTDWRVASTADDNRFVHSEPLVDFYALRSTGELFVFVQAGTSSSTSPNIYALDYTIGQAVSPTPAPGLLGDVNGDGNVNIVDALQVARYYVGNPPSGFITANADVNRDGSINIVDALRIAQCYVGLISCNF
jgi:hypothetical protein